MRRPPDFDSDHSRDLAERALDRWRQVLPFTCLAFALTLFFAANGERLLQAGLLDTSAERLLDWAGDRPFLAALSALLMAAGVAAIALPAGGLVALAAGLLFGPWLGAILAIAGEIVGAGVLFVATASAFRDLAIRKAGPQGDAMRAAFSQNGFLFTLALRLPPVLPSPLSVVMPAVLGARLPAFLFATALGSTPAYLILARLGSIRAFPARLPGFGLPLNAADSWLLSLCAIIAVVAALAMARRRRARGDR